MFFLLSLIIKRRKEGDKVASFKHKEEIRGKIKNLESNFTEEIFFVAVKDLKGLLYQVPFAIIEKWLMDLQIEFKWQIINGLLALLYHDAELFEQARESAIIASRHFPDTEIWDKIINNTLWEESATEAGNEEINN